MGGGGTGFLGKIGKVVQPFNKALLDVGGITATNKLILGNKDGGDLNAFMSDPANLSGNQNVAPPSPIQIAPPKRETIETTTNIKNTNGPVYGLQL